LLKSLGAKRVYGGSPASRYACVKGMANAGGTAIAAQNRAELNDGCSASNRAALLWPPPLSPAPVLQTQKGVTPFADLQRDVVEMTHSLKKAVEMPQNRMGSLDCSRESNGTLFSD